MPDALLVMVHGSPRPVANEEMFRVVAAFRERPAFAQRFPIVAIGFMECNEPSIGDAIDQCVAQGATRIVAVPYFLHTGNHVCSDLPDLLDAAQIRWPEVTFLMGDYVGLSTAVTGLISRRADLTP